jgi:hypothetical protein
MPCIERDCETVVFGAVDPIVEQAAPVVVVPPPLNPVLRETRWTYPWCRIRAIASASGCRCLVPSDEKTHIWEVDGRGLEVSVRLDFVAPFLNSHVASGLPASDGALRRRQRTLSAAPGRRHEAELARRAELSPALQAMDART